MNDKLAERHLNTPYYKTLCDYYEYLKYVRRLADTTIWHYMAFVADFSGFLSILPDKATRQDIIDYMKYKKAKIMQDSSLSSYIGALRSFYNWLADRDQDQRLKDIAFFLTKIVRVTREHTVVQVPSIKEVHRLRCTLQAFKYAYSFNKASKKYAIVLRDAAILEMLIALGPRSHEIRSIELKDFDFEEKTVLIKKGKGSRQRHSIFSDLTRETVLEHIENRGFRPDDRVFKMHGSMLNNILKKWAHYASVNERIHSHSLRHYHVTEAQRNGVPAQLVADQVGHVNLNTTRRYTHLDVNHRREHYDKAVL